MQIIVALIAGGCGLLTAIYASIAVAKNSKRLTALQVDLDKHKQITLEYLKAYMTLELEERNRVLQGFKEIISSVQLLRDKIRRVLEFPNAYSASLLAKEMTTISEQISEAYASNQVFLNADDDTALAHALKNDCLSAADTLNRYVAHPSPPLLNKLEQLQESIQKRQVDLRTRARRFAELLIKETEARLVREERHQHGK